MKIITVVVILLVSFLLGIVAPIDYTTSSSEVNIFGLGVHKVEAKRKSKKKKKKKTKNKKLTKNELKLANFTKSLISENDDDRTKISKIYNWITANISYYDDGELDDSDAYKTYKKRKGVCQDYTELLDTMLRNVGIKSDWATGPVDSGDSLNNGWGLWGHAWNEVKINGEVLYMDATWDAGRDPADYEYFLIPAKCIAVDHDVDYSYQELNDSEQLDYVKNNLAYFNERCPNLRGKYLDTEEDSSYSSE